MSSPQGNKNGPQGIEILPVRNGNALKYLRVKADGIGLEWVTVSGGGESNTSSNTIVDTSTQKGLAKAKVGVDLPFKVIEIGSNKLAISTSTDSVILDVNQSNLTLSESQITNLVTDLAGKASTSHTHPESDITNLTTDLSNKQPLDSDLTVIAGLTPTNDDVIQRKAGAWVNSTMSTIKTDLALTKSDVGLSNVDNTSDINKPISTATQSALDAKQTTALTTGNVLIGLANVATSTTVTGDVTISSLGVTTIGALKVTDGMLAGSITPSKITGTAVITSDSRLSDARAPTSHNVLDSTYHGDVLTGSITRGDLIIGNSTPKISRLAIGTSGKFFRTDGTDPSWQNIAESDVTNLTSDLAAKYSASNRQSSIVTAEISNAQITNALLADMATKTYKGRTSALTGVPEDVSVTTLKTDLSLNNVDNTSDANKPISTATQTALNLKVDTSANSGTGAGTILKTISGTTVTAKTIKAGTGITVNNNTDDITINSTGAQDLVMYRRSWFGI